MCRLSREEGCRDIPEVGDLELKVKTTDWNPAISSKFDDHAAHAVGSYCLSYTVQYLHKPPVGCGSPVTACPATYIFKQLMTAEPGGGYLHYAQY
jgi:hypothetical protein